MKQPGLAIYCHIKKGLPVDTDIPNLGSTSKYGLGSTPTLAVPIQHHLADGMLG